MSVIIQPATLLLIILIGYLFKHAGLFRDRDYRIIQKAEFDLILPGAIMYSFATNAHPLSFLWISLFGLSASLIPTLLIFLITWHKPVADRAFLMLNGSGFNIGCFCFPLLQSLIGPAALVPAAMFDVGNSVMVAAGTNVMTQGLLHIDPGKTLGQQQSTNAPVVHSPRSNDKDARKLRRRAMRRRVIHGFLGSPAFDSYMLMLILMVFNLHLPQWVALVAQPFSAANAFCAMLMVGMLTEPPDCANDVRDLAEVIAWRLPCAAAFAVAAWFLLPFDATIREAVVLCCFAPTAVFSTMFTDKVLGNAKLAGFTLSVTAVLATVLMTVIHLTIS